MPWIIIIKVCGHCFKMPWGLQHPVHSNNARTLSVDNYQAEHFLSFIMLMAIVISLTLPLIT